MGFNRGLEENLLQLEKVRPNLSGQDEKQLTAVAGVMEEHYTVLLLSVLFFFVSVVAYTSYSVFSSVNVTNTFTVRYLWFIAAVAGLMVVFMYIFYWNYKVGKARSEKDGGGDPRSGRGKGKLLDMDLALGGPIM